MAIIPYRPGRGLGATLLGDAQLEDVELQDADLTQPGVVTRGPGASELAARVHQPGGTEVALSTDGASALFFRPDVEADEPCMVHNDTLYTSKPTEITANGTQAWREVGTWAPWTLRQKALHQPNNFVLDMDVATIRDAATGTLYHVAVWEQGASGTFSKPPAPGVYAIAVDESGGVVAPATLLASGTNNVNPKACACNTGVVIVWNDTITGSWMGSAWRLSNPVEFVTAAAIVLAPSMPSPVFDMRQDGANDQVILALADDVGAFTIPLRLVTVSLVVTSLGNLPVTNAPAVGLSVDVDPLGGYLLTWTDGITANTVHVDATGAADTTEAIVTPANPIVRITGCHKDGVAAEGTVAVEQRVGASADYRDYVQVYDYDGTALTSQRTQQGAALWGHALVYSGRPVAWVEHWGSVSAGVGVQVLTDLRTGAVLARAWPSGLGESDSKPSLYEQPTTPHVLADVLYQAAAPVSTTGTPLLDYFPAIPQALAVTAVDGSPRPRKPAATQGLVIEAMAGYPAVFDGAEACEADWHVLPDIQIVTVPAGVIPAGTYVLAYNFLWVDREGRLWRSEPAARSVTVGAPGSLQATVMPCHWTARGEVKIEFWLSQTNQGFPLYSSLGATSDPSVTSQTFTITAVPPTSNEQLDQFAPANVLPHGRVAVTDFVEHALGRFWSPDPQRADIIRHSIAHEVDRDGFGWGWEETQLVQLDTSVRAQAMGPLDGPSLAVLAGDVCHLVYGLGPDKQGAGLFGQPDSFAVVDLETSQALTASVPDSAIPGGLAYLTPRGLFILRRDRVSQMLSAQVDRLFRVDGLVPQALAYLPRQGELMCLTLTEGQRSLRLSLTTGRWCADSARRAQDVAVSPRGEVAWLLADGRVRILDAGLIADGDDDLVFRGTTPTIRLDPSNVGQMGTVQAILLHTYTIAGPAALDIEIQDRRQGDIVALQQQVYSVTGPESRSVPRVGLSTNGHRIAWSQPAGDTGKLVITEIDSQIEPADVVIARTPTPL